MAHGKIKHKKFLKELKSFADEQRQARVVRRKIVEQERVRDIITDNFKHLPEPYIIE